MPSDPKTRARLANAQKAALHERLGGRCAECGSTDRLQVDHPFGRTYNVKRMSHYNRVRRYLKEEKEGLIRLLCLACNEVIRPRARTMADDVMEPF
jgi:hypothetical protein